MADNKPVDVDAAPAAEEEPKQEEKGAMARKKSLGGLDSTTVLSGPRQRKKAEHYQVEVKEKAEFVIKEGKGSKLGEIPNVHFLLGKLKTDEELLTGLHSLLFKRPGTANRRKKNLYEFSGLTFDEGDKEREMEKLQERLSKWTIALLNQALDVFELPRGNGDDGKKEAKVERLLKFLEEPKKLSEKDLAAQAEKKKNAAKAKKEKEQKSKTPKSAAKGGRKSEGGQESTKKKRGKKAESEEGGEEPSEEEDEAEPAEEAESEEEGEQPKKRAKKEDAGSAKKIEEKKTPAAKKTPGSRTKATTGKKRKADEEEVPELREEEPAAEDAGASAEMPDDETIKEATLALLNVSDVNTTTVKDLLAQLHEKFGVNLAKKKALIKRVAVGYAQSKAAASDEAGKEDAAAEAKEDAAAEDAPPPAKKQKKEGGDAAEAAGSTEDTKAEPKAEEAAAEQEAKDESMAEAEAKEDAAQPEAAEPEAKEKAAEPEAKEEAAEPEAKEEAAKPEAKEADEKATAGDAMETEEPKGEAALDGEGAEQTAGAAEDAKESKD